MKRFLILSVILLCRGVSVGGETTPTSDAQRTPENGVIPFGLDVEAKYTEHEIPLTIPADGIVQFSLIQDRLPDHPITVDVGVSSFIGETGESITPKVTVPGIAHQAGEKPQVKTDRLVVPLQLTCPGPLATGMYRGMLFLSASDKPLKSWRLALTRPAASQPVTPQVDQHVITRSVVRSFWGGTTRMNAEITVKVWEKNGQELHGVNVRVEQVAQAPGGGFDLTTNVTKDFAAFPSGEAKVPPSSDGWTIPANGFGNLKLAVRGLEPGEYNLTLRITAANAVADEAQKLNLVLHVADSRIRAGLVLLLAAMISFVGTKYIGFERSRSFLVKRIRDLRRQWLLSAPQTFSVVWARAMLCQSDDLAHRHWLSGLKVLEDYVGEAATLINLLAQSSALSARLPELPREVAFRARIEFDRIASQINPVALDDATVTRLRNEFTRLEEWFDSSKHWTLYWEAVTKATTSLLLRIDLDEITDPAHRAVLKRLRDFLDPAVPQTIQQRIAFEGAYARLKILWERRRIAEDMQKLTQLQSKTPTPPIEDFFREADGLAWDRVKRASEENRIRIVGDQSQGSDSLEAFQPLSFRATTGDGELDRTYLFSRGLTFKWTFTRTFRGTSNSFDIVTNVPQVVEFAQGPGTFEVALELLRDQDHCEARPFALPVELKKSTAFEFSKGLGQVEVLSWILATAIAIVSGLAVYTKGTSFGAPMDYFSMFLWGVGIDQGKNALQTLQVYANTTTAKASG